MNRLLWLTFILCLESSAQNTTPAFERIAAALTDFRPNMSTPPEDRLTAQIRKLRKVRGGFNIDEAIQFKIGEERNRRETSVQKLDSLNSYLTQGAGAQRLENAVIHIYRDCFSLKEIKQLTRFYRTRAGHKLTEVFPLIMLKSLKVAEELIDDIGKND